MEAVAQRITTVDAAPHKTNELFTSLSLNGRSLSVLRTMMIRAPSGDGWRENVARKFIYMGSWRRSGGEVAACEIVYHEDWILYT